MVKEGWKEVKLDVLYEFRSGLSKGKKFFGSGYPFLTYKEIFNNYFVPQKLNNLAQTSEKERINCSIKRGDVFLTRTSETVEEIGTSCVALKDYPNATFNGFAKRLRPKNNEIYPEYAVCYFRSEKFRNKAASMCSLITRASLNNDDLSHLTISYPKYDIQKKNATILLNYDLLIINIFNRIKILEKIAKLIYDEWFVKFKFPEHEKVKMVDSELGEIPREWKAGTVKDLFDVQPGFAFKSKDYSDEGFPIIKIKNIQEDGSIDINKINRIPLKIAQSCARFKLGKDDLLIAMTGATIGKIGLMPITKEPFYLNQRVARFIPKKERNSLYYLYFYSTGKEFRKTIENISLGAAQPNISGGYIENIKMLVPDEDTLTKFCKLAEPFFNEIQDLGFKNQVLHKTRDLLLPKLISGQVDVSDLDIKVPEMQEVVA